MRLLLVFTIACLALGASAVTCPNLNGDIVCRLSGPGFVYSDGCNTITCGADGLASSTFMYCKEAESDEEKNGCRAQERRINDRLMESQLVMCPDLSMDKVCVGAPKGFEYSDGCNGVTCDGSGSGTSTLMACPAPTKRIQREACSNRLARVIKSMPAQCEINKTAVCEGRAIGFRFNDGCNLNECTETGPVTLTRKMCPPAPAENIACKAVIRKYIRQAATGRSLATGPQSLTCPELAPGKICTRERTGFSYSDGCNTITCMGRRRSISTLMYCETAAKSSEFCQQQLATVNKALNESSVHHECLRPAEMCKEENSRDSYFNGCNFCFCIGKERAGCTRRACRPFFGTDKQFKEDCARRKVGIIKEQAGDSKKREE